MTAKKSAKTSVKADKPDNTTKFPNILDRRNITSDHKDITVELRTNPWGKYIRISSVVGGSLNRIIVPVSCARELSDAVLDLSSTANLESQ